MGADGAIWVEVRLVVERSQVDVVSDILFGQGAQGIQEDHRPGEAPDLLQPWDNGPPPAQPAIVLLRSWWPEEAFGARRTLIEGALAAYGKLSVSRVDESEWSTSWRAGFSPVRISSRLVVAPPWAAEPDDLQIEPGMAFGTGEHPSTRWCLEGVNRLAQPGETCLDVGTGSGVLALAAARLGMDAFGIDTDARAIREAGENAQRNHLSVRFEEMELAAVTGRFDLVVANIYAEVLVALAAELRARCAGRMVLSGILRDRLPIVRAAFSDMREIRLEQDSDWACVELAP
jgi:ribosomal protein L11 methyltransferase